MPYRLVNIEFSEPLDRIALSADQDGIGIVARWKDRIIGFVMLPLPAGSIFSTARLEELADRCFARSILRGKAERELASRWPAPDLTAPSLSIVICTKDRAPRLARLLWSLAAIRDASPFQQTQILVVDNAPSDAATRELVQSIPDVDYVLEPRPGLNFARNCALRSATGRLIAYLDDDVTVDGGWLMGLAHAWRGCPEAGGFTGLVLPFRLDTDAQIHFEARGGFGRGFERRQFHGSHYEDATYPAGTGVLGAGCNMAFDRELLLSLGGFDEALDTGAPLPGGGDLDIFYRVLRSGRPMVYEPRYAVYHEHRETIAQLRRQYWTWGLGFMAYITKCQRNDTALVDRHRAIRSWWLRDRTNALLGALRRRSWREVRFVAAELRGGLIGMAGEYDRSVTRVAGIRDATA